MYNFDTKADRTGIGNMKDITAPEALRENGLTVFSAAEMEYPTAPSVIDSIRDVVDRGVYGFTIPTDDYYNHVKWWMKEMRGWEIESEWIVPVLGTIFSVATAIRMTLGSDDAMIVQTPVYYRYEQAADRMGLRTVHNELKVVDGEYRMDFEDLEAKMANPYNKLLVLCNAHNPIGKVWSYEDLARVAELSAKYDVVVISDEIFGEMTFGGRTVTPYASIPEGQKNAITVTSLGKAFNFTGVNHANVIIPDADLRERYVHQKYADHYGSMGPFEYAGVIGAYQPSGKEWFTAVRSYIEANAGFVKAFLENEIPKAHLFPVEGTTVCWIDWSFLGISGDELHDFFEKEALFEVEMGTDYDSSCSSMTRINLSCTRKDLEDVFDRLAGALMRTFPDVM